MCEDLSYIRANIADVRKRIETAAARSGRKASDIRLVAVTKTIDAARIQVAVDEGIRDLGENRVQELTEKYDKINRMCSWHMIGHLQTNKVKHIIDKACLIHSLDSAGLAHEIQKRAQKAGTIANVLVQVNVAEEKSKHGIFADEVFEFIRNISVLTNVKVRGLMTIAPFVDNAEEVRHVFRKLRKLYIDIKKTNIDNVDMDYLSMGMSNDFEIAIEEGANIVRIGTAIFGKRCR